MAERELAIILRAKDLASKTIRSVNKELSGVGTQAKKGFGTAAGNIAKLGTAAAGISLAGIAGSIKVAADFESQLNTINTVAQQTPAELDKIGQSLRKMARSSGQDLGDLTAAYYDLVSAGIKPGADATEVLAQAQTLAVGGLATTSETVDLLTSALNVYGMGAKDAAHVTDVFAGAIAAGKTTAADLAAVFATVGPMAQASGIEIEELGAAFGTMTAAGVKPAQVATNIRGALVKLQKPTSIMVKLGKQMGVDWAKMAKDKGLAFTYNEIRKAADKAHIPLAQVLGDVEAQQFALGVTGDAAKAYAKNLTDAQKKTGVAAQQAAERQKGLNFQIDRLKALAIDAGLTIGSKLLPKLTPLAEKAVAFLETHQPDIEKFGDKIAGAFDKAAAFASKVPWGTIGSGLETAATWAGRLMDVFLKLPPEFQTTIIALAGLNKLSGGAVADIAGELGKGLIKGVLGMNAGVVNINAAVVNGGGGGLPGVGGAAAAAGAGGLTAGAVATAVAVPVVLAGGTALSLRAIADAAIKNNQLAERGLTNAEITAVKYFGGTPQYQQEALKRLGRQPSKADYESGMAKLRATTSSSADRTKDDLTAAAQKQILATARTYERIEASRITNMASDAATRAKLEAARQATLATGQKIGAAALATAAAIKAKDLSVKNVNNITINTAVRVSARETSRTQTTFRRYFSTAS